MKFYSAFILALLLPTSAKTQPDPAGLVFAGQGIAIFTGKQASDGRFHSIRLKTLSNGSTQEFQTSPYTASNVTLFPNKSEITLLIHDTKSFTLFHLNPLTNETQMQVRNYYSEATNVDDFYSSVLIQAIEPLILNDGRLVLFIRTDGQDRGTPWLTIADPKAGKSVDVLNPVLDGSMTRLIDYSIDPSGGNQNELGITLYLNSGTRAYARLDQFIDAQFWAKNK